MQVSGVAVSVGGTRDAVGEALGEGVTDGIAEGVGVAWSDGEPPFGGTHAQSPRRSARKRKRRRRIIVDIPCLTGNQPSHYTRTSSGCSADGSALALGARGPGFKSRHPDRKKNTVISSRQSADMAVFFMSLTTVSQKWTLASLCHAQMVDDDLLQAHKAHSPIDNLSRLR